ncbi:MAG: hypothetical protein OXP12_09440 [Thaumarchaeota archaeon]|nr:hypothetical protein [Nitrososphaerota archaeon]MDE0266278.1 hypothetical protein [Nitrososphaerota archaeon]MDE0526638.1 hypothetical protein [Nitrososphaerota archaeon]
MLTNRETTIALVANAIAVYSILNERGELPDGSNMYGFVLDAVPAAHRDGMTPDMIDEVFESVTLAHNS